MKIDPKILILWNIVNSLGLLVLGIWILASRPQVNIVNEMVSTTEDPSDIDIDAEPGKPERGASNFSDL